MVDDTMGVAMTYALVKIEGIGPTYAEKLKAAGLRRTTAFLDRAKDPKGRKALASETGIDEDRILKWANLADLMRIKGVGEEFSELLEAAGVDTVKELKGRKAENLHARMVEVNAARKLVRQLPSARTVASWIDQAKALPPVLTY
jgi:predicted flap endonuclease-1-like 5' DNA nuclease